MKTHYYREYASMDTGFSYYLSFMFSKMLRRTSLPVFHYCVSNFDKLSVSRDQDSAPTSVI